jgi:hypothetical protein
MVCRNQKRGIAGRILPRVLRKTTLEAGKPKYNKPNGTEPRTSITGVAAMITRTNSGGRPRRRLISHID